VTERGDLVLGEDGLARCRWAVSAADYVAYHDAEWGREVRSEAELYERLTLEAFQSGLSWLTILRKREGFRAAFAGFDPERVAAFTAADRARLLDDPAIVRNRAKVDAALHNAHVAVRIREQVAGGLAALVWSHAPTRARRAPRSLADVPSSTPESIALAKALKRIGWAFVGPTTAYAAMQACGLVDDHLDGCHARGSRGAGGPSSPPRPGGG
jgi:DNA-3-methyladenine glycosylase I